MFIQKIHIPIRFIRSRIKFFFENKLHYRLEASDWGFKLFLLIFLYLVYIYIRNKKTLSTLPMWYQIPIIYNLLFQGAFGLSIEHNKLQKNISVLQMFANILIQFEIYIWDVRLYQQNGY